MYRLRKLTRDALIIATVICALLILFSLQHLLSRPPTGNVIQVGHPEEPVLPSPEPLKQTAPLDPNMRCWIQRGLREEDYAIVEPLLRKTTCIPAAEKKPIQANIENNCLHLITGTEATSSICLTEDQPSFSIEFPTPASGNLEIPDTSPNYWLAFLLFFMGILILFLWGRKDLYHDYYRKRAAQDFTKLLPGQEEVEIRYITAPPKYLKASQEETKPVEALPLAPVKKAEETAPIEKKGKILSTPLNRALTKFNTLTQTLCDLIAAKKFTEAERQYPSLYSLALEIYSKAGDENKPRLLRVVKALHEELQQVRKAQTVVKDMRDIYKRDERQSATASPLVWKPAPDTFKREQIHNLDKELTKLRELLHKKDIPPAKK